MSPDRHRPVSPQVISKHASHNNAPTNNPPKSRRNLLCVVRSASQAAPAITAISPQASKVALKCSNKCFHGLSNPRNAPWSNTLLERVFVATFNHAVQDTLTASFQGK